jgi:Ras GTPase-activating-like protein IQGAP2/3
LILLVAEELIHLGSLASSIKKEIHSLHKVFKTVQEHNTYLKVQILTYKSYLQNVRGQTASTNTPYPKNDVNNAVNHTAKKSAIKNTGSSNQSNNYKSVLKIPYSKLEIDGVIVDGSSTFPTNRQPDIYFSISSCTSVPGSFSIELYCAGHEQSILCLELTLDDLLEKQQKGYTTLDLEYVKLDLSKTIILLNQSFLKGSKRYTSKTVRFQ